MLEKRIIVVSTSFTRSPVQELKFSVQKNAASVVLEAVTFGPSSTRI